jgi:hypothetical protein
VVQLVEALHYKPQGCRIDYRWSDWDFSLTQSWLHSDPGVDSASNRNEYQGYLRGGKGSPCTELTIFSPSCADCLDIMGAATSGSCNCLPRPIMG